MEVSNVWPTVPTIESDMGHLPVRILKMQEWYVKVSQIQMKGNLEL